jgi:hypothetical protein
MAEEAALTWALLYMYHNMSLFTVGKLVGYVPLGDFDKSCSVCAF